MYPEVDTTVRHNYTKAPLYSRKWMTGHPFKKVIPYPGTTICWTTRKGPAAIHPSLVRTRATHAKALVQVDLHPPPNQTI